MFYVNSISVCFHFMITLGTCQSICNEIFHHNKQHISTNQAQVSTISTEHFELQSVELQRFGHAIAQINQYQYLITGGFGVNSNSGHNKLNNGFILSIKDSNSTVTTENSESLPEGYSIDMQVFDLDHKQMHHTITKISDEVVFIYGGRTSPKETCCRYGLFKIDDLTLKPLEIFMDCPDLIRDVDHPICRWRHAAAKSEGKMYVFL